MDLALNNRQRLICLKLQTNKQTNEQTNRSLDNKSPPVLRAPLSIQAYFSSAMVWTVSILPLISSSLSLFSNLYGTAPKARTTIVITAAFMFFNSLARSSYLSSFSRPFTFTFTLVCWNSKIHKMANSFLLIN